MVSRHRTDVLVVGAGPVGLFSALCLAELGARVRIIDKHRRTGAHSYALALHPRSLELLAECGLADTLIDSGRRIDRVAFHEGSERVGEVDLGRLDGPYPFALVVPQSRLESAIEGRLGDHGIRVEWNHRLEGLESEENGIGANVAFLDRVASGYPIARLEWTVVRTELVRAGYIVAADGYHSTLRRRLGIDYDRLGRLETFSVFECETTRDPEHEVRVLLDPGAGGVLWPIAENRCRWSFRIDHPGEHEPTVQRLNRFLRERAPWFPEVAGGVVWSSSVSFDRRLAESMGRDRIWLVGDAAHLTAPIGVQSMNAGLLDAHGLAAILAGEPSARRLDAWGRERRAEFQQLLSGESGLAVAAGSEAWAGKHRSTILSALPATGEDLRRLLSQLGLDLSTSAHPA